MKQAVQIGNTLRAWHRTRRGLSLWASAPRPRILAAVAAIVIAAAGVGYLVAGGGAGLSAAAGSAAVMLLASVLMLEMRSARAQSVIAAVPWAVVLCLPLLRLVLTDGRSIIVAQSLFLAMTAVLVVSTEAGQREKWFAPSLSLAVPALVLMLALITAYLYSGFADSSGLFAAAGLLFATAFFVLPAGLVDTTDKLEWAVALLVIGSLPQMLVVAGQASGVIDSIPGLSALGTATWVGSDVVLGGGRYPGTFGDVELLAEYSTLVTVLGIGLAVVGRRRALRAMGIVAATAGIVTGWLTGTRGFVVGVAVGVLAFVMALLAARSRAFGRIAARLLVVAAVLVLSAYLLVPPEARSAMSARFSELTMEGPNAMNRGHMFSMWWRIAAQSPWFGYGSNMLQVIRNEFLRFYPQSPHSLYFWLLLTGGILLLCSFVWFMAALLFRLGRAALVGEPALRLWAAVFLAATVAWLANEVKIDAVRQVFYVDWLMFLLGLAAVTSWMATRDEPGAGAL